MAEIPYPTGPNFAQNNPLAGPERMMGLAQQMQAFQKEQMLLQAKQAAGEHMLGAVDEKTGEADIGKYLVNISKDPRTALIAPEIVQTALGMQKISYENYEQRMKNAMSEMQVTRDRLTPLLQKQSEGKNIEESDIASVLAGLKSEGIVANPMETFKAFKKTGMRPVDFVRAMAAGSERTLAAADGMLQSVKARKELVPTVRGGVQGVTTRENALGEMEGNPAGGDLAPSPAGRPGVEPSRPPAAHFMQTQISPGEEATQRGETEQFTKAQEEINVAATQAAQLQMRNEELMQTLKNFTPGPGASIGQKLGEIVYAMPGGTEELADKLARGDLSAMQEFQKIFTANALESLRQTVGASNRMTDDEVKMWMKNNLNVDTTPKAIEKILNFATRINKLAVAKAKALESWKQHHPGVRDITAFNNAWTQKLLDKKYITMDEYKLVTKGAK